LEAEATEKGGRGLDETQEVFPSFFRDTSEFSLPTIREDILGPA